MSITQQWSFKRTNYHICSRILCTQIFKGWFWIYFCPPYFTHHHVVHLPV